MALVDDIEFMKTRIDQLELTNARLGHHLEEERARHRTTRILLNELRATLRALTRKGE